MSAKKTIKVKKSLAAEGELEDTKLLAQLTATSSSEFFDATDGMDKRDRMLMAMEYIAILRHTLHETIQNL